MTDKKEWLRRRNEDAKQAHTALMKFYPLDLEDLDGEEWKPIPDFEELYQVSNFGRVKSFWYGKPRIMKPVLQGWQVENLPHSSIGCSVLHTKSFRKARSESSRRA